MRQIKYRGKSITENKWVYGSLINNVFYYRNNDGETLRPVMYILSNENDYDCWEDIAENMENCEVFPNSISKYVEYLDAYEGDRLYGKETDEYGILMESWCGVIQYNDEKGRIMILDEIVSEWYEIDDFPYDEIVERKC
jgi:hypothetical protein